MIAGLTHGWVASKWLLPGWVTMWTGKLGKSSTSQRGWG